ncbi:TetR/AcrR family transcriptional regulator [Elioraea sp.]|jgi:TetR/AcrR family transcriptional repressor of mexJK operon|uniref:TetR/AcrR family transcriptional regulator n=1 Tax=Elioraea sp. TaxID=2185103 RepID=UPI002628D6BC|nr:TetR/AcrR family transcriptional regulator [Elioraea sp.]
MMNDTHTVDVPITALTASQRKRRQVMEAAARLFMAQGYGATSMDAIAREAGVSKATLYAYFQGKDALFAAIVGEACERHAEGRPCCLTDHEGDLAGALAALGEGYLSFLCREEVMAIQRVVLAEGSRFPELGRAFYESGPRRMIQWVAGWFAALQRQGRLRPGDPAVAAEQFLALQRGSALMRRMLGVPPAPDAAEIRAVVAAAVETFLRAWGTGRER